jgi:hypothetical protein
MVEHQRRPKSSFVACFWLHIVLYSLLLFVYRILCVSFAPVTPHKQTQALLGAFFSLQKRCFVFLSEPKLGVGVPVAAGCVCCVL